MPVEPAGPVRPKLVLLEGNIGSGKSTILDWLQSHKGLEIPKATKVLKYWENQ